MCTKCEKILCFRVVIFIFIPISSLNIEHPNKQTKNIEKGKSSYTKYHTFIRRTHIHTPSRRLTIYIHFETHFVSFRFISFKSLFFFVRACPHTRVFVCMWVRFYLYISEMRVFCSNFTRLSDMETNQFHYSANDRTFSLWTNCEWIK